MSDTEAAAIEADHGTGKVYRTRWGELRTRVREGRCIFFKDGGCLIHAQSYYPAVCRGFPWTDAETGGAYEFDQTICPEFILHPEYVQIGKAAPLAPTPGDTRGRS